MKNKVKKKEDNLQILKCPHCGKDCYALFPSGQLIVFFGKAMKKAMRKGREFL